MKDLSCSEKDTAQEKVSVITGSEDVAVTNMLLPYGSFVFFWISTLFLTIYIYLILDLVRYTEVVIQREKGGNRSYYHFGEVNTVICQVKANKLI